MRAVKRIIQVAAILLMVLVCCTCFGQQSIGPTSRQIADFAFELTIQPAAKRAEMLAAHTDLITMHYAEN